MRLDKRYEYQSSFEFAERLDDPRYRRRGSCTAGDVPEADDGSVEWFGIIGSRTYAPDPSPKIGKMFSTSTDSRKLCHSDGPIAVESNFLSFRILLEYLSFE